MATPDNKISNVFGTALPQWLKNQIATRSDYTDFGAKKGQEDLNAIYRANKTAWIRVVSSININGDENDALMNDMRYFRESLGISDIHLPIDLAKKYVLFGGTSQYLDPNKSVLRSGLEKDGAYGMLGDKAIQTSGYRPMPGIIDAKIDTQGRLGSVRMATINFKVWTKAELDVIDALYFKLGYTMLIEWGHTVFVKTSSDAISKSEFGYSEFHVLDPFEKNMTKETINLKIAQNVRATEGNYDGMLGIVTNFTFSYNQDSGYDCMIKVIGLGALGDSLKINNSSNLPNVVDIQIKEYLDLIASEEAKKRIAERNAQLQQQLAEETKKLELSEFATTGESFNSAVEKNSNILGFTPVYKSTDLAILPETYKLSLQDVREQKIQTDSYIFYWPGENGNRFSIPKVKNILVSTEAAAKNTIVYLNLDLLNKEVANNYTLSQTGVEDYVDILAYNESVDYKTINSTGAVGFETGDYGKRSSNTGGGNQITWIQYQKEFKSGKNIIYRAEVTIPQFLTNPGKTNNRIDLFKPNYINNNSSVYSHYKIHDKIVAAIKDYQTGWSVDSQGQYNDLSINAFLPGIYKDTLSNNTPTLGLLLYKKITVSIPTVVNKKIEEVSGAVSSEYSDQSINYDLYIGLRINDASVITNFSQEGYRATKDAQLLALKNEFDKKAIDNKNSQSKEDALDQTASTKQISSALTYQSNLELAIKSIELYALTKAVRVSDSLDIGNKVTSYPLSSKDNREFMTGILEYGIFKDFLSDLFDKKINDDASWNSGDNDYAKNLADSNPDIKMRLFSKYGFSTSYMAAKSDGSDYNNRIKDSVPVVDYNELTTVYVVPYDINQPIEGGGEIVHPVYVQLGFLLMILNSMCTIYESESSDGNSGPVKPRPVVYIDYNPETNFCLTTPLQLTTNAFDFLIPMQASLEQYESLFPSGSIDNHKGVKSIKAPTSGSFDALFDPKNKDAISDNLPKFRTEDINGAYRGKTMKILISCEYILNVINDFSANDGMNDVYLKPFLEQLIKDLNKSLGGINVFRVSYDDPSNCFAIVDDQIQPLAPGEKPIDQSATNQLPLFGVKSIAKSINIQTEISSNLANMVAISANSNPNDQSVNSSNASSFGFINNSFLDRFIPVKKELTPDQIKKNKAIEQQKQLANYDSELTAAQKFNDTIATYYSKNAKPNKDSIGQATNYYINRMSKKMNEDGPTRASAMIPISVNFTTDGISGFNIGQAFTIPADILPYTYSTRQTPTIKSIQNPIADAKVAFATVGINHVIQGNVWDTSIKGSMMLIKDQSAFDKGKINTTYAKKTIDIEFDDYTPDNFISQQNYANYPANKTIYSNIKFGVGELGNPANEKINPVLLDDINKAAISAGLTVTITTGIKGHTSTPSRHDTGNAVDIAIIDGKEVSLKNRAVVDPFVEKLRGLGYIKNSERGNPKAVLTFGFANHDNHVHVSNKSV